MADSGDFRGPAATSARSGAGIISRIRLESLMCHSSLGIELGDWVNFITGQNGSGKSAILSGAVRRAVGHAEGGHFEGFYKNRLQVIWSFLEVTLLKEIQNAPLWLDAAAIPAATKADLRAKISQLEDQLRKAKKKIGEENIQKAVKAATEVAEAAASEGKAFCVSSRAEVGLDTTAVREAVIKVMDQKGLAIMGIQHR